MNQPIANDTTTPGEIIHLNFWNHARRADPMTEATCEIIAENFRSYVTIPASYRVRFEDREFAIVAQKFRFKAGDVVTFAFQGRTMRGLPRAPRFIEARSVAL